MAAVLLLGSALGQGLAAESIDWQPGLAANQPWRAFSAVFVHYSALHLVGNATGLALAAARGAAASAPLRLAWAWLAAWPLTQFGLLTQPALAHYGGLSGVVHAGVAIVCVHLVMTGHRLLGAAILGGLIAKVLSETPWGAPLRHAAGWDIAIAPLAHASGLVAGTACALLVECGTWRRRRRSIVGG